jgi:hypothetical protein
VFFTEMRNLIEALFANEEWTLRAAGTQSMQPDLDRRADASEPRDEDAPAAAENAMQPGSFLDDAKSAAEPARTATQDAMPGTPAAALREAAPPQPRNAGEQIAGGTTPKVVPELLRENVTVVKEQNASASRPNPALLAAARSLTVMRDNTFYSLPSAGGSYWRQLIVSDLLCNR